MLFLSVHDLPRLVVYIIKTWVKLPAIAVNAGSVTALCCISSLLAIIGMNIVVVGQVMSPIVLKVPSQAVLPYRLMPEAHWYFGGMSLCAVNDQYLPDNANQGVSWTYWSCSHSGQGSNSNVFFPWKKGRVLDNVQNFRHHLQQGDRLQWSGVMLFISKSS